MKFDVLYPNSFYMSEIIYKGSSVFKGIDPKPCWNCGNNTTWLDGSFDAYLCSEECEDAKWKEYFDAMEGK